MGLIDIDRFYSRMSLLLESSIEDLRKQWIETGKMKPEQFQILEKAAQGKSSWVTWLGKRVLEGQLTLKDEDVEKWQDIIKLFERYKQRFPVRDINQIKTRDQINQFVQTALDLKQQAVSKDTATQAAKDEFSEFYKGEFHSSDEGDFKVYVLPKGRTDLHNVSCSLANKGSQVHWCTASSGNRWFKRYIEDGPLIMFLSTHNPKKKYQLHVESDQFMDIMDRQIPWGGTFSREACQWALKNGIIKQLPSKLQSILEWEKDLPPKEGAPKLDSFKIYDKDGVQIYQVKNLNLKEHYWAFKDLLNMGPNGWNSLGKTYLVEVSEDKRNPAILTYSSNEQEWDGYPEDKLTKGNYEAAKFLNEKFGIEIPDRLLIAFDSNLPDPADIVVVPDLEGKAVYYAKNNADTLKLKSMLDTLYLEPGYIYTNKPGELGEKKGKFIKCEKSKRGLGWMLSTGWQGSGCTESQFIAFVKYLLSKDVKEYAYISTDVPDKAVSVLREELLKQYRQEDYEGATEIYLIREPLEDSVESLLPDNNYSGTGDALLFTLGKKVLLARENKFVINGAGQMSKIKTLKEDGAAKVKAILEHFNVDCKAFKEGLVKYFPKLLGKSDEEIANWTKVQKVPDLLRDPGIQDQMRELNVPLYRSRGRVIRLHQYAYPTTWDSVKNNFRESIDSGNYKTIVKYVGSEESPVYLYDNNGSWNCVIVCKDRENRTTGIIRRQGYDQSLNWNFSNAHWNEDQIEARQLDEVFNPVQKHRLMYLAGLLD